MSNNAEFKLLVEAQGMTLGQAAELMDLPAETVYNYTRNPESRNYRKMPSHKLTLFQLLLERNSRIT